MFHVSTLNRYRSFLMQQVVSPCRVHSEGGQRSLEEERVLGEAI